MEKKQKKGTISKINKQSIIENKKPNLPFSITFVNLYPFISLSLSCFQVELVLSLTERMGLY